MKRIAPSVRMKEGVTVMLGGEVAGGGGAERFCANPSTLHAAGTNEAEATVFLGRGHYCRGERMRAETA